MFEFPSQKYFQNMYLDNLIGSNFSKKLVVIDLQV